MRTVRFDSGLVYEIDDEAEVVRSVWPDGMDLVAVAVPGPETEARAAALGYSGRRAVWEMTAEHDLAHHLVARALGLPWSVHLRCVAEGRRSRDGAREEPLALLLQRIGRDGLLAAAV